MDEADRKRRDLQRARRLPVFQMSLLPIPAFGSTRLVPSPGMASLSWPRRHGASIEWRIRLAMPSDRCA